MTLAELLATADYSGLTSAEASILANEKRHAITVDVWHTYRSLAGGSGVGMAATRRLIQTMDAASAIDPLVGEMRHSLRGNGDPNGINANDPGTRAMLDSFAANTDLRLEVDDAAAIKALADSTESDVERHNLGAVREGEVQIARGQ